MEPKTYELSHKILGIDLGSTTGWAVTANGIRESGNVSFTRKTGRKTIDDDHPGEKFIQFQKWFREMIKTYSIEAVCYEEAMGIWRNAAARNIYCGFRGIVLMNCAYYNIPVYPVTQTLLKKHATGKGTAKKDEILNVARFRWPDLDIEDDNEADALFLLDKVIHDMNRTSGITIFPVPWNT